MPRNAIVLGMARSGTSLSASIFARKGYFVGENDVVAADHKNPLGYWESLTLLKRNEQILRLAGLETWIYDSEARLGPAVTKALANMTLGEEDRRFVTAFQARQPWVWKDPRLCYTLRAWWQLLDPQNTAVMLVERDPEAVFRSFVRVGWRKNSNHDRRDVYERTRAHMEHARRTLEDLHIPNIQIKFSDFANRPDQVVDGINQCFDLDLGPLDVGYDPRFNHDTLTGVFGTRLDQAVNRLPSGWIRFGKRLLPSALLRRLYPERYS